MGEICQSGAVAWKCGANVSPYFQTVSGANIDNFIPQAECFINAATRKDWSGAWANLSGDVKGILTGAVSDLAAIYCINFDMSGYTTRGEAESMITILRDRVNHAISILREIKTQTFMEGE